MIKNKILKELLPFYKKINKSNFNIMKNEMDIKMKKLMNLSR